MAKKTKSQNAELTAAQTAAPVAEATQEKTQTAAPKLIVAQHKFGRWYVYFKGVAPKDNVGCGCKTAKKLDLITLQAVTVQCQDRSLTYFIDPSIDSGKKFYFINCFNIVEPLRLLCETKAKTKSDRSVANIGKKVSFYDVTDSKEYETETAPLTVDECSLIEQMCLSPKVKIQRGEGSEEEEDFDAMVEILITDFTCEISDSNKELNKVKFTWQFADTTILELRNVISLRYDFYGAWRNIKILSSGECRRIRDVCLCYDNNCQHLQINILNISTL